MARDGAIEFENVTYSYGEGACALSAVSLRVEPGEFVAVVGANGSGKSTLAKHVNALLVPDGGTVRVAGFDTRDADHAIDVRRRAGMVFQNPDNQSVASIVRDDVAFGPENLGVAPEEIAGRVERALEAVGMAPHAGDEIHALSGGQKQLVAIAGVLAMEPEILVLDEPGAMLDVRGRAAVMSIVRGLHDDGMTVVLITHFMEDALAADRVIALDSGRVALEGTPGEVFSEPARVRELGLALPFSVELADELRARGIDAGSGLDEGALARELCAFGRGGFAPHSGGGDSGAPSGGAAPDAGTQEMPSPAGGIASSGEPDAQPDGTRRGVSSDAPRSPAGAPVLVSFEDVSYGYDGAGGALALHDLSFELGEGEILGIVGHTGSGKSTLAQLMNALLVPTQGRIIVEGMDTAERKLRRAVRARVGLVFQYPETQLFATSVAEDVAFGPGNLGLGKDEVRERCERALARVGLPYGDFAERSPFGLSGGQQRRVAIAGVLAMEPAALVLDEPAAGLDPRGTREMRDLLRELNAAGTTIVIVSHSMDEVAELCDRVLVLEAGAPLALGVPARVFTPENAARLRESGLGLPRATGFALELAEGGLPLGAGSVPLTTAQLVDALCERLDRRGR